jgi:hypothetical protein
MLIVNLAAAGYQVTTQKTYWHGLLENNRYLQENINIEV